MKNFLKNLIQIGIILAIVLPVLSFAVTAVGWNTTSPSKGYISPNLVNGVKQTIFANNGLFSVASSTFSNNLFLTSLTQGSLYTGSNGKVNTVATSTLTGTGLLSVTAGAYVDGVTPIVVSCVTCGAGSVTSVTGTWPILSSGGATPNITYAGFGTTTDTGIGNDLILYTSHTGIVKGVASSSLSLPNTALQNSTISGVALGSNLNSLSHGSTLTGTSYNGSATVSNWDIDLTNPNSWTGLQQFAKASSTLFSVYTKAYFGASATTTIDSAGNLVIPSGSNLTITGKSDGCATFATGVLNSTGSACGSGGGGTSAFEIATTSTIAVPDLAYFTKTGGRTTLGSVSTSTLTASSPLTGSFTQIGSGGSLGCTTASSGVAGCLSNTSFDTFNNKQATISATWPVILTGATLSFGGLSTSTAPNISDIPYFSATNKFSSVATSSIANGTNITVTNGSTAFVLGAQPTINLSGTIPVTLGGTGQIATYPANSLISSNSAGTALTATSTFPLYIGYLVATTTTASILPYASTTAVSATNINVSTLSSGNCVQAGANGLLTTIVGACGTSSGLSSYDAWSPHWNLGYSATTSSIGIGTTTPRWTLQVASSTFPQLTLSDTANTHFSFRSAGGFLYIGTSSPTTFATTTTPILTLGSPNGAGNATFKIASTTSGCASFSSLGEIYSTGSTCGSGSGGGSDPFSHFNGVNSATTTSMAIGTTTAFNNQLTISSTTAPQLSLSNGVGIAQWTFANLGGNLYISTTTVAGNATTSTAALTLFSTGKPGIAIGSSTPFATLSVNPVAGDFANQFVVGSSSATNFRIDNSGHIFAPNTTLQSGAATDYWCYDAAGQLIRISNTCTVSALKFKKDITPLQQGLKEVLEMQPVNYYLNDLGLSAGKTEDNVRQQIGFVADYSDPIVPLLVTHDGSGEIHGFNYEQYTAVLTKAIQELNTKVDNFTLGKVKRSAEENWQWLAIVLLILWNLKLTFRKRNE